MHRILTTIFISLTLVLPFSATASDQLAMLEAAARQDDQLQPGLENYQATVESARITEMHQAQTASQPQSGARPKAPVLTKIWLRGAPRSLIVAANDQAVPQNGLIAEYFASRLAIEFEALLLPAEKYAERQELLGSASVKSSEVALAGSLLQHFEITFAQPTDLGQAFYNSGFRLPRKQIIALAFDVDVEQRTISEMSITTAEKLRLTAEIRYRKLAGGGHLPERIRVTSPDGKVDDRFEITYAEIGGHQLPARLVRSIRRPDLRDELEVNFKDYRINQPLSEQIRTQLMTGP